MESRQSSQDENLPLPESFYIFIKIYDILEIELKSIDLEKTNNLEARISAINDFIEMLGSLQNFYSKKTSRNNIHPIVEFIRTSDSILLKNHNKVYTMLKEELVDSTELRHAYNLFIVTLYLKSLQESPLAIKCCKRLNITSTILLQFPTLAKQLSSAESNNNLFGEASWALKESAAKKNFTNQPFHLFNKWRYLDKIKTNHIANETENSFLLLSNEVLLMILIFLSKEDLAAIAHTCLKLANFMNHNKELFYKAHYHLRDYSLSKPINKLTSTATDLTLIGQLENGNFIVVNQEPFTNLQIWEADLTKCIFKIHPWSKDIVDLFSISKNNYAINAEPHDISFKSLIILPDNKFLFYLRRPSELQIWCGETGECLEKIPVPFHPSFRVLKDQKIIINLSPKTKVWNSETANWDLLFQTDYEKMSTCMIGELANGNRVFHYTKGIVIYDIANNNELDFPIENLRTAQLLENGNLLLNVGDININAPWRCEKLIFFNPCTSQKFPIQIYPLFVLKLPNSHFLVANEVEIHIYEGSTGKLINKLFHINQLNSFWATRKFPSRIIDIIISKNGGVVIKADNGIIYKIDFEILKSTKSLASTIRNSLEKKVYNTLRP